MHNALLAKAGSLTSSVFLLEGLNSAASVLQRRLSGRLSISATDQENVSLKVGGFF